MASATQRVTLTRSATDYNKNGQEHVDRNENDADGGDGVDGETHDDDPWRRCSLL